jgi:hypothetical protein
MKIIDNLLKASNGYICGVETSKEYKALVKKLREGNKSVRYAKKLLGENIMLSNLYCIVSECRRRVR